MLGVRPESALATKIRQGGAAWALADEHRAAIDEGLR